MPDGCLGTIVRLGSAAPKNPLVAAEGSRSFFLLSVMSEISPKRLFGRAFSSSIPLHKSTMRSVFAPPVPLGAKVFLC